MIPTRLLGLPVAAVVAVSCLTGCTDVVHSVAESIARGTESSVPLRRLPMVEVDAPDPALVDDPMVAQAARSVVKVRSVVPSCQKILEGSGVVIAPERVMSSAHVVAGGETVSVTVGEERRDARVVSFDPTNDISILAVPDLSAPPLEFARGPALTGDGALILGYPGGGAFSATPARIREVIDLNGPDIYRTTTVSRQVYVIRGGMLQGDSGGPLIDVEGRVLGIAFGRAVDDTDTSFVLTANQVAPQMISIDKASAAETGACIN